MVDSTISRVRMHDLTGLGLRFASAGPHRGVKLR
jgi:hypothetical protein